MDAFKLGISEHIKRGVNSIRHDNSGLLFEVLSDGSNSLCNTPVDLQDEACTLRERGTTINLDA